jgi:hypothetical protein
MLPARYAGRRDQVDDFLTGELEAGSFVPRRDSWLIGFDAQFSGYGHDAKNTATMRSGANGWARSSPGRTD